LAADFVAAEQSAPPVAFSDLLYRADVVDLQDIIMELIAHKETVGDAHRMQIPSILTNYLKRFRATVSDAQKSIPRRAMDMAAPKGLFRELVGYLKRALERHNQ
ncbi:MAG: hypothetical protein AAF597_18410, partial [Bacteroidota bacterium]